MLSPWALVVATELDLFPAGLRQEQFLCTSVAVERICVITTVHFSCSLFCHKLDFLVSNPYHMVAYTCWNVSSCIYQRGMVFCSFAGNMGWVFCRPKSTAHPWYGSSWFQWVSLFLLLKFRLTAYQYNSIINLYKIRFYSKCKS